MNKQPDDDMTQEMDHEVTSVDEYVGTVLLVPFDTPMPAELSKLPIASGSLLSRLNSLSDHEVESFEILPLRGAEMLQLANVWPLLVEHKKIYVLRGLPGTRYDILFDQGVRAIGLPDLQWPNLASAMARAIVERQRTADSEPWKGGAALATDEEENTVVDRFAGSQTRKPIKSTTIGALPTPPITDSSDDGSDDT